MARIAAPTIARIPRSRFVTLFHSFGPHACDSLMFSFRNIIYIYMHVQKFNFEALCNFYISFQVFVNPALYYVYSQI